MKPTTTPYPAILTSSAKSLRAAFDAFIDARQQGTARGVTARLLRRRRTRTVTLRRRFSTFAHAHQLPPERANSGADWTTWLMLGGRGAGKTRAGAEWVRALAQSDAQCAHRAGRRDRARRARGDGRGRLRPARGASARRAAAMDSLAAAAANGRTARWRRCSRRRIRRACAARNSPPPGATNSPSGAMPKQLSICCSSGCALANGRGR